MILILALVAIIFYYLSSRKSFGEKYPDNVILLQEELPYTPEITLKANDNIFHPYQSEIVSASAKYYVPQWVIVGLINIESGGNPNARGKVGEIGLMQISPTGAIQEYRERFGYVWSDKFFASNEGNIKVGTWYLSKIHGETGTNWLNSAIHVYQTGVAGYKKGRRSPDRDARLERFKKVVLVYDADKYTV